MFCPTCRDEFQADIRSCPDCHVDLVPELPRLVLIERTRDPDRLARLIEALEKADVPYVIEAGTALSILDGDEEPPTSPELWRARLWVSGSAQQRAADVITAANDEAESVADGATEDVVDAAEVLEETENLDPSDLQKPVEPR
jgi:hypothetical protein